MILFRGNAFALSREGLARATTALGVDAPVVWTILADVSTGCGFLPDRRPQILYERDVFHRMTGGRYDDGDISSPTPGGYGPSGAPQYDRLARAIARDKGAALKSTSWGIGQIMGENYATAGFPSVEDMVAAMLRSEDDQLAAMAASLIHSGLHTALQAHDWATFSKRYNEFRQAYVIDRYDVRLSSNYQRYAEDTVPDLDVRAAQLYLSYLGFHPGPVDGVAGVRTLAAFAEFSAQHGFHDQGILIDAVPKLLQALPAVG